ncbi:MAG: hypothetical protein Q9181_004309, partial [Wetmoreana brouardii]
GGDWKRGDMRFADMMQARPSETLWTSTRYLDKRNRRNKNRREGFGQMSKPGVKLENPELNYAYYALLSHLSSLVSTLASLRNISSSTTSLLETFETSTSALTREIGGTISQFSDLTLQAQTERSQKLENRLKRAREKVGTLEYRLKEVRGSIEKEEAREKEVSRTRKFRWKCLGFLVLSVCGLMIFGDLVRHLPGPVPEGTGSRGLEDRVKWEDTRSQSQEMEDMNVTSMMNGERDENTTEPQLRTNDRWEPRLRMLEEL